MAGPLARKAVPILALSLAGCVTGAGAPSPTDPHGVTTTTAAVTTTVTRPPEEGLAGFRQCMSDQEIALPEIPLDAFGRPRMASALQHLDLTDRGNLDALEMCGSHLANGALGLAGDPEMRELVRTALQDLVVCLRARGVDDFPEPVPGYDGLGSPFPINRIPWSDPDLAVAVSECVSLSS